MFSTYKHTSDLALVVATGVPAHPLEDQGLGAHHHPGPQVLLQPDTLPQERLQPWLPDMQVKHPVILFNKNIQ